jgi:hypothetical protein
MRQTKRALRRVCNVMTDSKDFIRIPPDHPSRRRMRWRVATSTSHETPIPLRERRMAHLNTPNGDTHA